MTALKKSGRFDEAKETIAAARALRVALLRMRTIIGRTGATATVCERYADVLLGNENKRTDISPELMRELDAKLRNSGVSMNVKLRAILGDRTMQVTELYQAILATGQSDYQTLKSFISSQLNRHSGDRGEQLFIKVRHGWYRNRRKSDKQPEMVRLIKGQFVRSLYDTLGKLDLTAAQLSQRLLKLGTLPPERCDSARVAASLSQHTGDLGARCFERVSTGVFRARPGQRPLMDMPTVKVVAALKEILRHGPLHISELHAKYCARLGADGNRRSLIGLEYIIRLNLGTKGSRAFTKISTSVRGSRIYGLVEPDLLVEVMRVMNDGKNRSPKQVCSAIADIGRAVDVVQVQHTMATNSGFGQPLVRVRTGIYVKNPKDVHHNS